MGELIYMFASLAARHRDGVTCLDGMRRLADTLHPHGVKINWIVSPESARITADTLKRWHDENGDEIAVLTPLFSGDVENKKRQLAEVRDGVRKALPWADLTIAATEHPDPDSPVVLEALGFEGLWGFCWEQIEVDGITDRGCPWGLFYMDRDERLRPAKGSGGSQGGVIGMEWTARDLLKSFHSQNPCLYSTDPNDVARGGICSWENIDYWKGLADNYIRNLRYNEHIFLLQHQEAHESERNDFSRCYTREDIDESIVMMDEFVKHIKGSAKMMSLQEAVRFYRERYETTPSSYMLWTDTPTPPSNPDFAWSMARGPWPKTFLYYDRDAQMMFVDGKVEPVCIRNYHNEWRPDEYFMEPWIPRARLVSDTRYVWDREIEFSVSAPKAMPYGVAIWGDYALYQIDEAPGLIEGKMLSQELLFLRYDLKQGDNLFRVKLQGK